MSGNKLVLVGLVLIALLFAGGVAAGAIGKDASGANRKKEDPPDWGKALMSLGGASRVPLDKVQVNPPTLGTARSGIKIPAGGECKLNVQGEHGQIRTLDLVVADGLSVTVSVTIDKETKEKTFKPGEKSTLAVRGDGLEVTVRAIGTQGQGFAKITLE